MSAARQRLDELLVARGLAESRAQAKALIMSGRVRRGSERLDKPGKAFPADIDLSIEQSPRFVSRGGEKLQGFLDRFAPDLRGAHVLDVGASTGGFTDCVLQRGARAVIGVDVGYGQLAWSLRQDARVTLIERCNIRHLAPTALPAVPDMAVVDVSFISLEIVLPKLLELLPPEALIVALVKPQFEVGKGQVGGGGIVRDAAQHGAVLARLRERAVGLGCALVGECESPIRGAKGNREFFLALRTPVRA